MNTRDHRPDHLPKVLALMLALCVLVSAAANAPGWMRAQAPQRSIAASLTPQIDPAAEPVAVLAMAEPTELMTAAPASASGNTISHGFDADVAPEYTLAASYESADEQHVPAPDDSTTESDGGYPVRLAALRSSALAGGARSTSGARSATGGAGSSSVVAPGGKTVTGNSPGTSQPAAPAAGGSPADQTESAPKAPTQPVAEDLPSSEQPGSSSGDGALADADAPRQGNTSTVDEVVTAPPVDQTPIGLLPIEPSVQTPVSVPEPATLGLLLLGLAGIAGTRRRRATTQH